MGVCLCVCQFLNRLRHHREIFMVARYGQKRGRVQKWVYSDMLWCCVGGDYDTLWCCVGGDSETLW